MRHIYAMALTLFIPLLVVQSVYSGDIPIYELSEESIKMNVTYNEAKDRCEALTGGRLPDDRVNHTSLKAMMQKKMVSSVWTGIHMFSLGNWTWADGDQDTTLGPDQGTGGRVCAGVSTVSQNIQPKSCNYGSKLEGVLCQNKVDLEECSKNFGLSHCFKVGTDVFSFKCNVNSWYDARFQCHEMNASIAKLNTTNKIVKFVKTKNKIPSLSLCNFFWVGLRKEEWMVKNRTEGNTRIVAEGTAPFDSAPEGIDLYIGVGLTVGVALLCAIVGLVWWYCRRQRTKLKSEPGERRRVSTGSEEETELIEKQGPGQSGRTSSDQENDSIGRNHLDKEEQPDHQCKQETKHGQDGIKEKAEPEKKTLLGNTRQEIDKDAHKRQIYQFTQEAYQSKMRMDSWSKVHTGDWNKMVNLLQPLNGYKMKMAVLSNNSYIHDIKKYLRKRRSPALIESLLQVVNGDQINEYFELYINFVTIKKKKEMNFYRIKEKDKVIIVTSAAIPNRFLNSMSGSEHVTSPATGATGGAAEYDNIGYLSALNIRHAHILVAGEKLPKLTDDLVIIRPAPVTYLHGDTEADFYVPVPHQLGVTQMYQSAAYYTSLVIMIILRMAKRNLSHPTLHKELRDTRRMRLVLLDMCAPPGESDEPRVLDPWRHLTSWDSFKAVTLKRSSNEI